MRSIWLGLVLAAACNGHRESSSSTGSATTNVVIPAGSAGSAASATHAAGEAAYAAHDYAGCAAIYAHVAAAGSADRDEELYDEACCEALGGKSDVALATLQRAIDAGWRDAKQLGSDADLSSLHADRRWPDVIAKTNAAEAAFERSLKAPDVRAQLLAMVTEDQAQRMAWVNANKHGAGSAETAPLLATMETGDRKRTAALQAIVDKLGWPDKSAVGEDGAHAAWLLVQHADQDPAFPKRVLAMMEPLVKTGEVDARDYAYLYDRVAVHDQRPQRWGTQFKDGYPDAIEDEAHVDERRAAIGLPSMAAYKQQMIQMYGSGAAK
ncbi:MAG TPA: DUF6624 domain-containing protein [Kofleriaceae bacterium]|jgi:hypothetical protein